MQIQSAKMRSFFQLLRVSTVNENGPAPRRIPAIDVAPAVPHHIASGQRQAVLSRGMEKQTRSGLAALAGITVVVIAHIKVLKVQTFPEPFVHRLNR
jgi:hypothetical protein